VELEKFLYKDHRLTRDGARIIFGNLVELLNHLRSLPELTFIHSDLKLANILIDPLTGKIFLIDFGLSSITGMQRHRYRTFPDTTKEYAPPEYTRQAYHCWGGSSDSSAASATAATADASSSSSSATSPLSSNPTPLFDAHHIESWQLGLILYFLLVAPLKYEDDVAPFDLSTWMRPDVDWEHVLKKVVGSARWKSFDGKDNAQVISLISGCCAHDPATRLTLGQITKHPWLVKGTAPVAAAAPACTTAADACPGTAKHLNLKQCQISETVLLGRDGDSDKYQEDSKEEHWV